MSHALSVKPQTPDPQIGTGSFSLMFSSWTVERSFLACSFEPYETFQFFEI